MAGVAALTTRLVDMSSLSKSAMNINRRWFRFSLRTMFLLVTTVCGILGWNLKIVRERQAAMKWLEDLGGSAMDCQCIYSMMLDGPRVVRSYNDKLRPSWLRKVLGDKKIMTVELPPTLTTIERNRIWAIFPEAQIQQWSPSGWFYHMSWHRLFRPFPGGRHFTSDRVAEDGPVAAN
jgi:hypothetical protein